MDILLNPRSSLDSLAADLLDLLRISGAIKCSIVNVRLGFRFQQLVPMGKHFVVFSSQRGQLT